MSFLYGDPKASQIDFPERTLIYIGIRMVTVIFLPGQGARPISAPK